MQKTTSTPTPTRGISGFRFLVMLTLFVGMLFAIGTAIGVSTGEHQSLLQDIIRFFREYGIKLFVAFCIGLFLNLVFFVAVLDTPLYQLSSCLVRKGNDSHVILFIAMFAVAGIMVVGGHGANAFSYVTALLQQGSLGLFSASLVTVVVARCFGVKSMDEFAGWVEKTDNDSYAILVAGILLVLMYIAMSV